ncbi:hypothetical protein HpBHB4_01420 [Helicobacter pylori]
MSRFQIKNGCIYGVCSYKTSKFVHDYDYEESKAQVLNALKYFKRASNLAIQSREGYKNQRNFCFYFRKQLAFRRKLFL